MRTKELLILITIFFAATSCEKENMGDCFKSTGEIVREDREISTFDYLELNDRINLFVSFGPTQSISVEAGENLQEHVITEVSENTLIVRNDNRCNWVRSFKKEINVYLTLPTIRGIRYYGSGELRFIDTLKTDLFTIDMFQASGDAYLLLNTTHSELKTHTGPGTITAGGYSEYLVAFVGGNGFVDASGVKADRGLAVATNTGYIRVNAVNELEASISGTGNIEYFGNPNLQLTDTGEGQLIQR